MTKYKAQFPSGTPSQATLIGGVMFKMIVTGLQEACKANDLSRDGITTAFRKISKFDTGLGTTYDFTDPKKAPSTSTYILQPNKSDGGRPQGDPERQDRTGARRVPGGEEVMH